MFVLRPNPKNVVRPHCEQCGGPCALAHSEPGAPWWPGLVAFVVGLIVLGLLLLTAAEGRTP